MPPSEMRRGSVNVARLPERLEAHIVDVVTGRRRINDTEPEKLAPGEYVLTHGVWYVRPPYNDRGQSYIGQLFTHQITEHDDGTISVSPSILQSYGDREEIWHGYLTKGIWRRA